jgi:hypothetical protein
LEKFGDSRQSFCVFLSLFLFQGNSNGGPATLTVA